MAALMTDSSAAGSSEPSALDRMLARLDALSDATRRMNESSKLLGPHSSDWPPPLRDLRVGRFRWLVSGIHFAELLRSGMNR